jgi:hypothetical protein
VRTFGRVFQAVVDHRHKGRGESYHGQVRGVWIDSPQRLIERTRLAVLRLSKDIWRR